MFKLFLNLAKISVTSYIFLKSVSDEIELNLERRAKKRAQI